MTEEFPIAFVIVFRASSISVVAAYVVAPSLAAVLTVCKAYPDAMTCHNKRKNIKKKGSIPKNSILKAPFSFLNFFMWQSPALYNFIDLVLDIPNVKEE